MNTDTKTAEQELPAEAAPEVIAAAPLAPELAEKLRATTEASTPTHGHLSAKAAEFIELPPGQRINRVYAEFTILHPALAAAMNEAHWLITEPPRSRARGLIVVGDPGSGKTTIAKLITQAYPLLPRKHGVMQKPGVLRISLSGARTTKALLSRILLAAGVPVAKSYAVSEHDLVAVTTLGNRNCRALCLDEVQDMLNGRITDQVRLMEYLKYLMNELQLPMLCLGTGRAVGRDNASKACLRRRSCRSQVEEMRGLLGATLRRSPG